MRHVHVVVALAALLGAGDAKADGETVTLEKRRGHFFTHVSINGVEAGEFLVDTGATTVAIPVSMARQCGVDGPFKPIFLQTATSVAVGHLGQATITVGPFTFTDVDVVVTPGGQPLLGMSFLSQLDIRATPTTFTMSPVAGVERIAIDDIDADTIALSSLEMPSEIGNDQCAYDVQSDRWRCDEHVYAELDGAATSGATAAMSVRIELLRANGCLSGVHMYVSADKQPLVVPWNQSVVVEDGARRLSPRASIGRSDGAELSYLLSLADRCLRDDDRRAAHELSWSVPVLVGGVAARVKWIHRWTPTTVSEAALLDTMTPPELPPAAIESEPLSASSFPLWTSVGGAAALATTGVAAGIASAAADDDKFFPSGGPFGEFNDAVFVGAAAFVVSAPVFIGAGVFVDTWEPKTAEADEASAPRDARALERKKHSAYLRQVGRR